MCFLGCKSQIIEKNIEKPLFKNFNLENWKEKYKKYKKGIINNSYIYKNIEFYPQNSMGDEYVYIYIYIYIYTLKRNNFTQFLMSIFI